MGRRGRPQSEITIPWYPQPRQLTFLRAAGLSHCWEGGLPDMPKARILGYGGSAGGGKSDALFMLGVAACLTFPGAQVAYFRRKFTELEGLGGAIQRSKVLLAALENAGQAKWNATQHRWTFDNGSILGFNHCQQFDDIYAYQSQQFDVLLFDEGTHFEEAMISYLYTRNRLTVNMPQPICAIGSNPGNVGHAYFRRIFDPMSTPETVRTALWTGAKEEFTTYFIPAFLQDNELLEQRDPTYRKNLESQPKEIRDQLLLGRWDTFAGQAFPEFDPAVHVVEPFEIPYYWRRWRTNDPGYTEPFAWYWLATDESGEHVYVYREFTREPLDPKLAYSEQGRKVTALSVVGTEVGSPATFFDDDVGHYKTQQEQLSFTVTGMDAFNKHPETGKSIAEYYSDGGVKGCIPPVHGPGARSAMKATYHEYLRPLDGPHGKDAKLKIFSTCKKLVSTLPVLVTDPDQPERVLETSQDHWYQALGYGIQAHHAKHSAVPDSQGAPSNVVRLDRHKKQIAKDLKQRSRYG